jgi:tRNA(adenine34) deaminase
VTPDELLGRALEVAEAGLAAGELPIGAVVALGDEIVGSAFTRDRGLGRRLAHADIGAMTIADEALGWRRRPHPLRLAVTLEPCVMCLGAAMSLRVDELYYGLEAPGDGGVAALAGWRPGSTMEWYALPQVIVGGLRRAECRDLYRRYCETAPQSGFLDWAREMAGLPDAV